MTCEANDLLGVEPAPNAPSEGVAIAVELFIGMVGGGGGAPYADAGIPMPHVRRQVALNAHSSRRRLRPARRTVILENLYSKSKADSTASRILGTAATNFNVGVIFSGAAIFDPVPVKAKELKGLCWGE